MEASGLHPGDAILSTSPDNMHARIEVHMRQVRRLLRALGANSSNVVGGAKALPTNTSFRVNVPLPEAVRAAEHIFPSLIDGFFMWNLVIA